MYVHNALKGFGVLEKLLNSTNNQNPTAVRS